MLVLFNFNILNNGVSLQRLRFKKVDLKLQCWDYSLTCSSEILQPAADVVQRASCCNTRWNIDKKLYVRGMELGRGLHSLQRAYR